GSDPGSDPSDGSQRQRREIEAGHLRSPGLAGANRDGVGQRARANQLAAGERLAAGLPRDRGGELRQTQRGASQGIPPRSLLHELAVLRQLQLEPRELLDDRRNGGRVDPPRLAADDRRVLALGCYEGRRLTLPLG